jgi:hypothetical protein
MWTQRMIWLLGRIIFYMLLLPLLVGIVYALSHEQWTAALIFLVLCVLVLYKGLIRVTVPANSLVVRDGKVVFHIPEKSVRDRFDFASRGQTIVQMPHFGLLDRPYKLEVFSPDNRGGLHSCRLSLDLGYLTELTGWQRAYDNFVRYQERLPLEVKRQLFQSSAQLAWPPPTHGKVETAEYLRPIVAELNLGLENLGLKIEEATCTFTAGPTLVRFVAAEQEIVEKAVLPDGASREGAGLAQEGNEET